MKNKRDGKKRVLGIAGRLSNNNYVRNLPFEKKNKLEDLIELPKISLKEIQKQQALMRKKQPQGWAKNKYRPQARHVKIKLEYAGAK